MRVVTQLSSHGVVRPSAPSSKPASDRWQPRRSLPKLGHLGQLWAAGAARHVVAAAPRADAALPAAATATAEPLGTVLGRGRAAVGVGDRALALGQLSARRGDGAVCARPRGPPGSSAPSEALIRSSNPWTRSLAPSRARAAPKSVRGRRSENGSPSGSAARGPRRLRAPGAPARRVRVGDDVVVLGPKARAERRRSADVARASLLRRDRTTGSGRPARPRVGALGRVELSARAAGLGNDALEPRRTTPRPRDPVRTERSHPRN